MIFLKESETALNLNPNSPYAVGAIGFFHVQRARELMRRSLKIDPLIDDLIDGLKRTGMQIETS